MPTRDPRPWPANAGGAVTDRRESDAVREARDAFVIVAAVAPVAAVAAGSWRAPPAIRPWRSG